MSCGFIGMTSDFESPRTSKGDRDDEPRDRARSADVEQLVAILDRVVHLDTVAERAEGEICGGRGMKYGSETSTP